jgi:hypothetical protein
LKKLILKEKQKGEADVSLRLNIINKKQRHAVLATLMGKRPYTSLVAFALTPDARSLLFATPRKTQKYRNILKNKNVSLLLNTTQNIAGDYKNAEAITIQGTAHAARGKKKTELAAILSLKHPALKPFIKATSTSLIIVKLQYCVHVDSFQQVTEWRLE